MRDVILVVTAHVGEPVAVVYSHVGEARSGLDQFWSLQRCTVIGMGLLFSWRQFREQVESNAPREYVEAHFRRVMKGNVVSDLVF